MKRILLFFFITLTLGYSADEETAQETAKNTAEESTVTEAQPVEVLQALMDEIEEIKKRLLDRELSETNRLELEETLARLREEFYELLAGKESLGYYNVEAEEKSFQEELVEIFDPIVGEVKSATAQSREKQDLRTQIELLTQKKEAIQIARERLGKMEKMEDLSPGLSGIIQQEMKKWTTRYEQTNLELDASKLQLREIQQTSGNTVESASKLVAKFFKTRGLHLLLALFLSLLFFFLITYGYKYFRKVSPLHENEEFYNSARTLDGAIHLTSIIVAIFIFMLTLFLCDDWVLLTAFLFVLVGIVWSMKDKIADIAEEVRLILNVGSVREGEVVNMNGLSWQVQKIRVYSHLHNPELDGGTLRIPVNQLVGTHSRPAQKAERFFPTSVNDWVVLSDGTFGKVLQQNPSYVNLVQLGGSQKTYKIESFLELNPENLSGASFRISSTFGVDYKHQEKSVDEIPEKLQEMIKQGICAALENEKDLKRLKVEFSSAAASSLDYTILADFSGTVAPKYNELRRLIQRLAVEACNEHGWEIPFTQVTVHQA